jgi:hypothetical protein
MPKILGAAAILFVVWMAFNDHTSQSPTGSAPSQMTSTAAGTTTASTTTETPAPDLSAVPGELGDHGLSKAQVDLTTPRVKVRKTGSRPKPINATISGIGGTYTFPCAPTIFDCTDVLRKANEPYGHIQLRITDHDRVIAKTRVSYVNLKYTMLDDTHAQFNFRAAPVIVSLTPGEHEIRVEMINEYRQTILSAGMITTIPAR